MRKRTREVRNYEPEFSYRDALASFLLGGCGGGTIAGVEKPLSVIEYDPDKLGGVPVFRGTRVPVQRLFDHLEAGDRLDELLEDFPTVSRGAAIAALEIAKAALSTTSHHNAAR